MLPGIISIRRFVWVGKANAMHGNFNMLQNITYSYFKDNVQMLHNLINTDPSILYCEIQYEGYH